MSLPYAWTLPRAVASIALSLQYVFMPHTLPDGNATLACSELSSRFQPGQVIWPSNMLRYQYEINAYYSQACADLLPRCIVYPEQPADVSYTVNVLLERYTNVALAVKSGGHNHNPGFNNVHGGTVEVGPGARWGQVQSALDPLEAAAVGGRMSDVGVGGSVLGGGFSFLSPKYGLACDNVVDFEIVLPNGTITHANAATNANLFLALRGGGGQFGIVTKFTMRTHPIGKVWGGYRMYWYSDIATLTEAYHTFLEDNLDPGASVIITYEHVFQRLLSLCVVFFFYDRPIPTPGTFGPLEDVKPLFDNTKTRSYASLLRANDLIGNTRGARVTIRMSSIPALQGKSGKQMLKHHVNTFNTFARRSPRVLGLTLTTSLHAVPRLVAEKSIANGNNALDADPNLGDHLWFVLVVLWCLPSDDFRVNHLATELTDTLERYVKETAYQPVLRETPRHNISGLLIGPQPQPLRGAAYFPRFMNEANSDQNIMQSYGERSCTRMRAVKADVDPRSLWAKHTVGWRV